MAKREANEPVLPDDPLWYKDAIIYETHVRAFFDSNGDGIGDFPGLTQKLDYLQDLGVTAIWLLPFYPSPLRDDGYDIADYHSVHPDYGTLQDFRTFLRQAHRRGLRVISELVINHTSDKHPWFQRARRAKPGTPARDFYVWSESGKEYSETRIIFKDFEPSNWAWDPVAQAHYWHRFYSHQPDLNFDNPRVEQAVFEALDFWMEMGVDGLRLDAVPYLYEREGTNCENLPETHDFLRRLRRHVDANHRNRMLLAEANQWPEDAAAYFGNGDECHMNFHFPVMPRLFMSLQMEDRLPITDILEQTPPTPDNSQWAIFLRNHDELTLEMVTDEERDYMYRMYASDPRMRINLGIRRRLAPLLQNNRRRIELLNGLLMSLPGTPVIYYGDEIGMGDNIYLGDRNGVRTPMQWSGDRNAGFSRANPQSLYFPVIIDPEYHSESVNVEAQLNNPQSLLWWMRRLIALRRQHVAFGRGSIQFLEPENPKILAFLRCHQEDCILVVANLSRFVQHTEIDLHAFRGKVPVELFGGVEFPILGERPLFLTLSPHAFYWFVLRAPAGEHVVVEPDRTLPSLDLAKDWDNVFEPGVRSRLEPIFRVWLRARPHLLEGGRSPKRLEVLDVIPLGARPAYAFVLLRATLGEGESTLLSVPVGFAEGEQTMRIEAEQPGNLLARVVFKSDQRPGTLYEICADEGFARAVHNAIRDRRRPRAGEGGELVATRSSVFAKFPALDSDPIHARQIHSDDPRHILMTVGDRFSLKLYRRLEEDVNPDLEIARHLTEHSEFAQAPRLGGALEYVRRRGHPLTLVTLLTPIQSQSDGWTAALEELQRYYERVLTVGPDLKPAPADEGSLLDLSEKSPPEALRDAIGPQLELARALGQRVAELHIALAADEENAAMASEPFTPFYQRSLLQSMRNLGNKTVLALRPHARGLGETSAIEVRRLIEHKREILSRFRALLTPKITGMRLRIHGDLTLRNLFFTGRDFLITGFEGKANRTLGERRLKRSPLRDVASLLRSIDHAALVSLAGIRSSGLVPERTMQPLETWAAAWARWVNATLLHAYLSQPGIQALLPPTREQRVALLEAFLMEDALAELASLPSEEEWIRATAQSILEKAMSS